MDLDQVLRFLHLLGAAVWIGGMITVGALVPALRAAGVERPQLQAMARRFGVVAWLAMGMAVATGVAQLARFDLALSTALAVKILLVGVAISVALIHQMLPKDVHPGLRGAIHGVLLLVGIAILATAVAI